MIPAMLTALSVVREKGMGSIINLYVTPVTRSEFLLGKQLPYIVLALLNFGLLTLLATTLFAVPLKGNVPTLAAGPLTFVIFSTGFAARSMPQFGMLTVLILLPLQLLSGGFTPRASMPEFVQIGMLAAPTTHFVSLDQAILYRGAGLGVVWPQFLALAAIGAVFFAISLNRFRKTTSQMA